MITTIELSPYISVQGVAVSTLPGGNVEIALNGQRFVGRPVLSKRTEPGADPKNA